HSRIKTRMAELGSPLAGEMSGHFFFREWFGIDDALFAAARLCRSLAQSGRRFGAIVDDLPRYAATPELRVPCPDGQKFGIVTGIQERYRRTHVISDLDGARIEFESGWGLVRASNTEPALVVRAEGRTPVECEAILSELKSTLAELGVPWPRD
ncbi:MAG TPA: phosphomannomutase, partial [Candidatus Eisenbacteria bacterium]|nr:phosphomannomutase [Candidatus Eisenbacteria bacterium]